MGIRRELSWWAILNAGYEHISLKSCPTQKKGRKEGRKQEKEREKRRKEGQKLVVEMLRYLKLGPK
jgi:hypothetical protein